MTDSNNKTLLLSESLRRELSSYQRARAKHLTELARVIVTIIDSTDLDPEALTHFRARYLMQRKVDPSTVRCEIVDQIRSERTIATRNRSRARDLPIIFGVPGLVAAPFALKMIVLEGLSSATQSMLDATALTFTGAGVAAAFHYVWTVRPLTRQIELSSRIASTLLGVEQLELAALTKGGKFRLNASTYFSQQGFPDAEIAKEIDRLLKDADDFAFESFKAVFSREQTNGVSISLA